MRALRLDGRTFLMSRQVCIALCIERSACLWEKVERGVEGM